VSLGNEGTLFIGEESMVSRSGWIVSAMLVVLLSLGCVSKGTYTQVVQERDGLTQQLTARTSERDDAQKLLNTALSEVQTAKSERDSVQRELSAARTEVTRTTGERDIAQASLAAASQRVASLQDDLTRAQTDVSVSKQSYDGLKTRADKLQKYSYVAEGLLRIAIAGAEKPVDDAKAREAVYHIGVAVAATRDPVLKAAWEKYVSEVVGSDLETAAAAAFVSLLVERLSEVTDPDAGEVLR
jgi:multidrug efflux pump subunit AcrA (membrane-fusion protein)